MTIRCHGADFAPGRYTTSIDVTSPDTHGQSRRISVQLTTGCPGDCSGNGQVTVGELVQAVNVALGKTAVEECSLADDSGDRRVTIDELVNAVNNALKGCRA